MYNNEISSADLNLLSDSIPTGFKALKNLDIMMNEDLDKDDLNTIDHANSYRANNNLSKINIKSGVTD